MAENESGAQERVGSITTRREILAAGIVQGVGFRPFVYRIARKHNIAGTVCNTSQGVRIIIEGAPGQIAAFLTSFEEELPPLAQVTAMTVTEADAEGLEGFEILPSTDTSAHEALVPPDVSICHNCLRELYDPADRRFQYPFINCTDCGPRYTIIVDVPYDREQTSMIDFPMCAHCRKEYENPADRRFHAEATCCPQCGPALSLFDNRKNEVEADDPIAFARERLHAGKIVAVKGIGGFHLAVDAMNHTAVEDLRRRKGRGFKPFALMTDSVEKVKAFCEVSEDEEKMLTSSIRPIMILRKRRPDPIADGVAPGNRCFGVMLAYTPLHRLLLGEDFAALVMTSGNLADEPIVIDDEKAFAKLGHVADYFLTHNRRILYRSDDSIVKLVNGRQQMWRRSRGYVPRPFNKRQTFPAILACGAMMKSVVALTRGGDIFLSQHLGDIDSEEGLRFFEETIEHLKRMLGIAPEIVAYDLHPDYLSTQYATALPAEKKIGVQHHAAHIASCQCEHEITDRDVIGFSLDGTGYGLDGNVWGGEVLVGRPPEYDRAAHFEYVPMPGGEQAIKQPWRMTASHLLAAMGRDYRSLPLKFIGDHAQVLGDVEALAQRGIHSPLTSSCGRLFDAVSAMLGLADVTTFEGEPAMRLEMAATHNNAGPYGYELIETEGSATLISPKQIFRGIAKDIRSGASAGDIAWRFHVTLIDVFVKLATKLRDRTDTNAVALGGGVFLNEILLTGLTEKLKGLGFEVYQPEQVPPGDGGVSLGQVAIARAAFEQG